jgi:hypothetical protein
MNPEAAFAAVSEHYEKSCAVGSAGTFVELVTMYMRLSRIDMPIAFEIIAENFHADFRCFLVALALGEVAILRPPHSDRLQITFNPETN